MNCANRRPRALFPLLLLPRLAAARLNALFRASVHFCFWGQDQSRVGLLLYLIANSMAGRLDAVSGDVAINCHTHFTCTSTARAHREIKQIVSQSTDGRLLSPTDSETSGRTERWESTYCEGINKIASDIFDFTGIIIVNYDEQSRRGGRKQKPKHV